jgi:HK97 family phage prohead protease
MNIEQELRRSLPPIAAQAKEAVFRSIERHKQGVEMEHKHFAIEELKADDETRTIEGFGSIFGNVDSYGDIVVPGAFAKSIAKRKPAMLWQHRTDMPIGVWDEMEETAKGLRLKGRILDTTLGEDAYKLAKGGALTGLSIGYSPKGYEIDEKKKVRKLTEVELFEVSLVTFPANDKATITRVKSASGDIDTAVSLLTQAASLCETGMAMTAEMSAACRQMIRAAIALLDEPEQEGEPTDESADSEAEGTSKARPDTLREFEEFLREAGFSQKDATTVALRGFKALSTQGEPDEEVTQAALRAITNVTNMLKGISA